MYQNDNQYVNNSRTPLLSENSVSDSPTVVIIDDSEATPQLIDLTSDSSPTQDECRYDGILVQPQHVSLLVNKMPDKPKVKESLAILEVESPGEGNDTKEGSTGQSSRCTHCNKSFTCNNALKRHILIHLGKKTHKCPVCSRGFIRKDEIHRHMITHTGEKSHWCTMCDKGFVRSSNFYRHMRKVHDENLQNGSVNSTEPSQEHQHSAVHRVQSDNCVDIVNEAEASYQSVNATSGTVMSQRKQIDFSTTKLNSVRPVISHAVDEFPDLGYLRKHLVTADSSPPIRFTHIKAENSHDVDKSMKSSKSSHSVDVPNKDKHSVSTDENYLSPSYKNRAEVKSNHEESGNDKKFTYRCSVCKIGICSQKDLLRHMMIHTGERPHTCKVCNKGFIRPDKLRRHMKVHTGEKPHQCSVCSTCFHVQSSLNRHMKLCHSGNRHQCPVCHKGFQQPSDLHQHMAFHKEVDAQGSSDEPQTTRQLVDLLVDAVMSDDMTQDARKMTDSLPCDKDSPNLDYLKEHLITTDVSSSSTPEKSDFSPEIIACTSISTQDVSQKFPILAQALNSSNQPNKFPDKHSLKEPSMIVAKLSDHKNPNNRVEYKKETIYENHSVCSICKMGFCSYEDLQTHKLTHAGDEPYKCPLCDKTFYHSKTLHLHMMTHATERPNNCPVCNKWFTRPGSVHEHMVVHTGEKLYQCSVCDRRYTQARNLRQHMLTHKGEEKPYKCPVCGHAFTRSRGLRKHMMGHQGKEPYKCSMCNEGFQESLHLDKHMKAIHKELNAQKNPVSRYKACSSPILEPEISDVIYQDVSKDVQVLAQPPPSSFSLPKISNEHKLEKTFTPVHRFANSDDGRSTATGTEFERSAAGKSHKCSFCNKAFHRLKNLRRHMKTHTGLRKHRCSICKRGFLRLDQLRRHMISHTGEKRHKCALCYMTFTVPASLTRHMKNVHKMFNGPAIPVIPVPKSLNQIVEKNTEKGAKIIKEAAEKRQKCPFCNKTFYHVSCMHRHMKHHTGHKNHLCSVCKKGFFRLDELKRHMISHGRREKRHKCSVCSMRYTVASSLYRHMRNAHNISTSEAIATKTNNLPDLDHHKEHLMKSKESSSSSIATKRASDPFPCKNKFSNLSASTQNQYIANNPVKMGQLYSTPHPKVPPEEILGGQYQYKKAGTSSQFTQEHVPTTQMNANKQGNLLVLQNHQNEVPTIKPQESGQQALIDSKPHNCPTCNIRFRKFSVFEQHLLLHKSGVLKTDSPPNLALVQLNEPKEQGGGRLPYTCAVCDKRVKCLSYLKRHMESHSNEKPHKCPVCKHAFKRFGSLKNHLKTYRHNTMKTLIKPLKYRWNECYECCKCVEGYSDVNGLTAHMVIHKEGNKPMAYIRDMPSQVPRYNWSKCHDCLQCIEGFTHDHELSAHMVSHEKVDPLRPSHPTGDGSPEKPKKYVPYENSRRKPQRQRSKKQYKCIMCNKTFRNTSNLKKHIVIHTGEKPFKCSVCQKRFTQATSLRTHMRIHTGEKPYVCPVCNMCFTQPGTLYNHKRNMHSKKKTEMHSSLIY